MPLLICQKVGKGGNNFPTFIWEASRLQITLKNRALISYLHLNTLELIEMLKRGCLSDMIICQIHY